jgi:hypothetical protein
MAHRRFFVEQHSGRRRSAVTASNGFTRHSFPSVDLSISYWFSANVSPRHADCTSRERFNQGGRNVRLFQLFNNGQRELRRPTNVVSETLMVRIDRARDQLQREGKDVVAVLGKRPAQQKTIRAST